MQCSNTGFSRALHQKMSAGSVSCVMWMTRAGGKGCSAAGMGQGKSEAATGSSSLLWHFTPNYCYEVPKQLPPAPPAM